MRAWVDCPRARSGAGLGAGVNHVPRWLMSGAPAGTGGVERKRASRCRRRAQRLAPVAGRPRCLSLMDATASGAKPAAEVPDPARLPELDFACPTISVWETRF